MKIFFLIFFLAITSTSFAKLTFLDEFDNNSNNWIIKNNDNYHTYIDEGKYFIEHKREEGSWFFWKNIDMDYEKDFVIESKINLIDGVDDWGYGLVFSGLDADNIYVFNISGNGQYNIYKYENAEYTIIHRWSQDEVINMKGIPNVLKISQVNKRWSFWVNDKKLFDTLGMITFGNYIGFVVSHRMTIAADYLKVEYDTARINLVENVNVNVIRENLGRNVNSQWDEIMPVITQDSKRLYFIRKDHPENFGSQHLDDIWYSEFDESGKWSQAVHMDAPLNNDGYNSVISVSADGNSLMLMNEYSEDGRTLVGGGISLTTKTKDGWSIPKKINIVNSYNRHPKNYSEYCLSSDKNVLILSCQRDETYGDKDIYISFWDGEKFTEPQNLGYIVNTHKNEMSPFLASDNRTLYFSSYGHAGYGSADVFVTRRLDSTWFNWSEPKNLGLGINTTDWDAYYTIPASGDYAYFVSYNNSFGEGDIFRVKLPEAAKPKPVILVYGKVLNSKTNDPVDASIKYNDLLSNQVVGTAISDPKTGDYKIILPYGKEYSFLAEKEGFYSISQNLDATNIDKYSEIERNLLLAPIEIGEKIRLNNIFFDYDKAELRVESYPELNRLIEILKKYSDLKIEIGGHTDNIGNNAYNLRLSTSRAKSVMDYLLSKGIDKSRITYKGYGESQAVDTNDTEEGRQNNRRVEFKIINK